LFCYTGDTKQAITMSSFRDALQRLIFPVENGSPEISEESEYQLSEQKRQIRLDEKESVIRLAVADKEAKLIDQSEKTRLRLAQAAKISLENFKKRESFQKSNADNMSIIRQSSDSSLSGIAKVDKMDTGSNTASINIPNSSTLKMDTGHQTSSNSIFLSKDSESPINSFGSVSPVTKKSDPFRATPWEGVEKLAHPEPIKHAPRYQNQSATDYLIDEIDCLTDQLARANQICANYELLLEEMQEAHEQEKRNTIIYCCGHRHKNNRKRSCLDNSSDSCNDSQGSL